MRNYLQRGLCGALFAGCVLLLGAGAASAAETSGTDSTLGGNQVLPSAEAPVTVGGNAVSILGDSDTAAAAPAPAAAADTGSETPAGPATPAETSGEDGLASGNQIGTDAEAPVSVGGNAVSNLGDSDAAAVAPSRDTGTSAPATGSETPAETSGGDSTLGGNQVDPAATVPLTVRGNAISVLGSGATVTSPAVSGENPDKPATGPATEDEEGTAPATPGGTPDTVIGKAGKAIKPGKAGTSAGSSTAGGNGNLANAVAPVHFRGNAASRLGGSAAGGTLMLAVPAGPGYAAETGGAAAPSAPTGSAGPVLPNSGNGGSGSEGTPCLCVSQALGIAPAGSTGSRGTAGSAALVAGAASLPGLAAVLVLAGAVVAGSRRGLGISRAAASRTRR